jgi:hypothetical protein
MPEDNIWSVASPLKRSEYLASGMAICGIAHHGHAIEGTEDFIHLFKEEEFISRTVNWFRKLEIESLREMQLKARDYAEKNLSWDHSVDVLDSMIRE